MEIRSVKCDQCATELVVDSPRPHRYGIVLSVEDFGINTSGSTYAVYTHKPLHRTHHFCSNKCLRLWVMENCAPIIDTTVDGHEENK